MPVVKYILALTKEQPRMWAPYGRHALNPSDRILSSLVDEINTNLVRSYTYTLGNPAEGERYTNYRRPIISIHRENIHSLKEYSNASILKRTNYILIDLFSIYNPEHVDVKDRLEITFSRDVTRYFLIPIKECPISEISLLDFIICENVNDRAFCTHLIGYLSEFKRNGKVTINTSSENIDGFISYIVKSADYIYQYELLCEEDENERKRP